MPKRRAPVTPALSAPDLTGPVSFLAWPLAQAGHAARPGHRPMEHVHIEVDLLPVMERTTRIPGLRAIEEALREAEVIESGDLLTLTAGALEAFASTGWRRVDHWEVRPGGWLPLRHAPRGPQIEPVRQFLDALRMSEWKAVADARELAARLADPHGNRLEVVVRRAHRERQHALSIDLHGSILRDAVHDLTAALHRRLPVLRAEVTSYRPASLPGRGGARASAADRGRR